MQPLAEIVSSGLQPLANRIFRGLSPSYDRTLRVVTLLQDGYWKKWLLEEASIRGDERILDVGCGTGVLEEYITGNGTVVGVDLTGEMLRVAQHKALRSFDSLCLGDAERLPFGQDSFDIVVSCYVVKYCNPHHLAAEASRVLRPGGKLVLYDFSRPRGVYAPFLAFYVYGVLRAIGLFMRLRGSSSAFTYEALPSVIQGRQWDDEFDGALSSAGFREIGMRRLSGGAATGFCATKSSSSQAF